MSARPVPAVDPDSALDLDLDAAALTAALVDVPSVSGDEARLAGLVEDALRRLGHLRVSRHGDTVLARTDLGRARRVLLAGHLDTVPTAGNVPSRRDGDLIRGCGTSDMKSGDAVMLRVAATVPDPACDLTFVFYDCEEVEAERNGLGRLARAWPGELAADLAILLEPTDGNVEAGCQGTLRAVVRVSGRRAHSARSWLGDNAIHRAAPVLELLASYRPRAVTLDGCQYREGLNAVAIGGGVAGNVIPDECEVTVNYRFAPDRDVVAAEAHVRQVFAGFEVSMRDSAPGALPGLDAPAVRDFLTAVGVPAVAKYGWTDVARFAELGVPALNYGPGDPNLAHTRDEHVRAEAVLACERALSTFLTGAG
ncbi:MAG TPA: succinyl-diaminopimelate desuccinylase [Mycobacteriales bacterium]|nr:succinyl-diaminopimelate desuccinylase [Mycobacteriales bacterium]